MIHVGVLTIDFQVTDSLSLKHKRFVLRSIRDRVRQSFNVSVAEVDHQDKWQASTFGVSAVSNEKKHLDATLNKVKDFFEKQRNIVVTDHQMEII
ncbi:DUF503 domain-containing protein [Candidatus Omnitrophota bacterium]